MASLTAQNTPTDGDYCCHTRFTLHASQHQRPSALQRRSVVRFSADRGEDSSSAPGRDQRMRARCAAADSTLSTQQAAKKSSTGSGASSSVAGTGTNTPLTSISANGSTEDLTKDMQMAKLNVDRSGSGVLTSDVKSRDIHIENYTLSFHGRLLIESADLSLNWGQRYGLLGENGSGKVSFPFGAWRARQGRRS